MSGCVVTKTKDRLRIIFSNISGFLSRFISLSSIISKIVFVLASMFLLSTPQLMLPLQKLDYFVLANNYQQLTSRLCGRINPTIIAYF